MTDTNTAFTSSTELSAEQRGAVLWLTITREERRWCAAYLAGLTVGVYQNTDELTDLWRSERRFLPTLDRPRAQELMERWEHAVRQTVL
jgi:glycerol kinase